MNIDGTKVNTSQKRKSYKDCREIEDGKSYALDFSEEAEFDIEISRELLVSFY